eukprot:31419-Pelagococcus_subviridis.AAC.19
MTTTYTRRLDRAPRPASSTIRASCENRVEAFRDAARENRPFGRSEAFPRQLPSRAGRPHSRVAVARRARRGRERIFAPGVNTRYITRRASTRP